MYQLLPADEKANKEYKDAAFRMLFNEESNAAELYNAISGTNYTAGDIEINTLESPLFFGNIRNDVSFRLNDKWIILLEHQSSINPNLGLRCLFYIAIIYWQLIDRDGLYKSTRMEIEKPEFVVLYNGTDNYPEKTIVKLSDLFRAEDGKVPNLEVIVTVYNVNAGHNAAIMKKSDMLKEYSLFIAKVREYLESGDELTP